MSLLRGATAGHLT